MFMTFGRKQPNLCCLGRSMSMTFGRKQSYLNHLDGSMPIIFVRKLENFNCLGRNHCRSWLTAPERCRQYSSSMSPFAPELKQLVPVLPFITAWQHRQEVERSEWNALLTVQYYTTACECSTQTQQEAKRSEWNVLLIVQCYFQLYNVMEVDTA